MYQCALTSYFHYRQNWLCTYSARSSRKIVTRASTNIARAITRTSFQILMFIKSSRNSRQVSFIIDNNLSTVLNLVRDFVLKVQNPAWVVCMTSVTSEAVISQYFLPWIFHAIDNLVDGLTLGQKSTFYPKIHILKISIFTKFLFLKSHFSQNSHF